MILDEMNPEADVDMYIKTAVNSDATCQYGTALELLDWAASQNCKPVNEIRSSHQDVNSTNGDTAVQERCDGYDIVIPKVDNQDSIIYEPTIISPCEPNEELKKLIFDVCRFPEPERISSTVELVEMVKADTYSVREPFIQVR